MLFSSLAGLSFGVMSLKDVLKIYIPFTISRAWEIGRRVIRATRKSEDPVRAVLEKENGSLTIITGKVTYRVDVMSTYSTAYCITGNFGNVCKSPNWLSSSKLTNNVM